MLNPDTSLPLYVTSMSSSFTLEELLIIDADLNKQGIDHIIDPDGYVGVRAPQLEASGLYPPVDLEVVTSAWEPVREIIVLGVGGALSFDIMDFGYFAETNNHQEIVIAGSSSAEMANIVKVAVLLGYKPDHVLVMHKSHA